MILCSKQPENTKKRWVAQHLGERRKPSGYGLEEHGLIADLGLELGRQFHCISACRGVF